MRYGILNLKYPPILIPVFLAAIIYSQYYWDINKKDPGRTLLLVIPHQIIKMSDLGLDSAAASLMWLYTIQNIIEYKEQAPKLIRTVTSLDSKFSYPYAFAALVLPEFGQEEDAIKFGREGIEKADRDWRIPYYLATTYHIYMKDRVSAAVYFDLAARTPGAPANVSAISSRYGIHNSREQTKTIWRSIYETSDDEFIKERAANYLTHIEMFEILERTFVEYKRRYGKSPSALEDLISAKLIKEIPKSPLGVSFGIDNQSKRLIIY